MRAVNNFGCAFFPILGNVPFLQNMRGRRIPLLLKSFSSNSHLLHLPSYLWSMLQILEIVFCSSCCYLRKKKSLEGWTYDRNISQNVSDLLSWLWEGEDWKCGSSFLPTYPILGKRWIYPNPLIPFISKLLCLKLEGFWSKRWHLKWWHQSCGKKENSEMLNPWISSF